MPPEPHGPEVKSLGVKTRLVQWSRAWRIIATRYPPIDLFERVSDNPAVWEALIALEQLTNPRIRDEIGEISLVPPDKRVAGANASWVMAPFTHINKRGSRFSDGTFGVYYAAEQLETAIRETAYHFARFAEDASDPARREDMRVLLGAVDRTFEDVSQLDEATKVKVLDIASYAVSQPYGRHCRDAGCEGLAYPSVRHEGGQCIAAFWPNSVGIPIQERHLQYEWDGKKMSRYFDYSTNKWEALA
jgi:RES domain-containing protein